MSDISFSKECRTEAMENFKFSKKDCCNISFLKGYFYAEDIAENSDVFAFVTDIEKSLRSVKKLLSKYDINCETAKTENSFGSVQDLLLFNGADTVSMLHNLLNNTGDSCQLCRVNFLTGVFVSSATLSDPLKEYHLEFSLKDENKCDDLLKIFSSCGFEFKKTFRKQNFVVYTKNSRIIEDFLATVGAQNAFMSLVQSKVEKDVRNRINRQINCETANIAKTIKASRKYILAVEKLKSGGLFDSLPDDLKELAELKAENPDLPLSQLGKMCRPPLTKSTVNRKLNKLCTLAQIEE